jgi:hypothetical protein
MFFKFAHLIYSLLAYIHFNKYHFIKFVDMICGSRYVPALVYGSGTAANFTGRSKVLPTVQKFGLELRKGRLKIRAASQCWGQILNKFLL